MCETHMYLYLCTCSHMYLCKHNCCVCIQIHGRMLWHMHMDMFEP